jgi:hypothetical protein
MMMGEALWVRFAGMALAAALMSGVATAQGAPNAPLGAKDLRAEMFGVHLYGVESDSGIKWDECIAPDGATVYTVRPPFGHPPIVDEGRLAITDAGQMCFSYPPVGDPEPACFRVVRRPDGYVFVGVDGSGTFLTTKVERGVTSCPMPSDLVG